MRKAAEDQAKAMVEQQEVMRVARARSSEMIASAEAKSRELRKLARDYVADIMRQCEDSVTSALNTIQLANRNLHSATSTKRDDAPEGQDK